ncbi:MAG TPA: hypothetical protein VM865_00085, partial [Acidobacteriaceae bacterium]|nr:hypothetical protein [Acidobacteriaceae bacterium]
MQNPILLIAPEPEMVITDLLQRELELLCVCTRNRRAGLAALRRAEYSLVLLDESLEGADPTAMDILFQNAGAAPVLVMNLSSTGGAVIVRQVRSALQRRAHYEKRALEAAARSLRGELRASLSGLLLESELALQEA